MSSPFVIGERVWVRYEEDWWPAKVINVEQLTAAGLDAAAAGPNHVAVMYYGADGGGALVDYDPDVIAPFEASSEKAVTTKADIKAAIKAAVADDTAVIRGGGAAVAHTAKSGASAGARRPRATTTHSAPVASTDDDVRGSSSSKREEMGDVEASGMEQRLSAAVAAGDLAAARTQLLRAVRVGTSEGQLRRTKVGRAVGSVLAAPALQPLHALAKCVLRGWASAVPAATREALSRAQTFANATAASSSSAATAAAGAAVSSPLSEGGVGSPMSPSARFAGGADAYFAAQVVAAFEKQNCHGANTPEAIAAFVAKAAESLGTEFKRLLIKDIQMPDHDELRRNLLTGAVTLAQFTHFTAADHQPPTKRREDEARRLREAQELEEAKRAETSAAATDMFPCPKCAARAATFYEKQIRSADEPATTFLTCTKCKHQWTLN
jgi:transcription elongation factor S-II